MLTVDEFREKVAAEERERAAAPRVERPDPYEAFGAEIEAHPVGVPFCRALRHKRALARQGVEGNEA